MDASTPVGSPDNADTVDNVDSQLMDTGELAAASGLSTRIQRYLSRTKPREDNNGNGEKPAIDGMYSAISKKRAYEFKCHNLNGTAIYSVPHNYGSFFNANDERPALMHHRYLFDKKQNISFSFDPASMQCTSCGTPHAVLSDPGAASSTGDVFVLADQNFPPVLPTPDGRCVRIVRIENGSLTELAEVFLKTVSGWSVRVGSVVAITSASRLAQIGLAGYAEEMVRAARMIIASLAGGG